jgi:uncharacterized protein YutE (UPF0331/DUF86 family)
MMTSAVRAEIVAEKIAYIRNMVEAIRSLPQSSYDDFSADARNAAAAESYLRRALEALFDLGRHILVKAFAAAPAEYKQIAEGLAKNGVLSKEEGRILTEMAGYRNRMVHFYHEIGERELYDICRDRLIDIQGLIDTFAQWLREHPEKVTGP